MKQILMSALFAVGMIGCSSDFPHSPTGPTAPPVAALPQAQFSGLRGGVADSAYRPLPGARVEVTSGPHAGQSTTADSSGAFTLDGPFDEGTQFKATRDGHAAALGTLRVNVNCPRCSGWFLFFVLDVPTPPVNIAGDYRLTFAADSACELPLNVKTRTYSADIRPVARANGSASTSFNVSFPNASFFADYAEFQIHVAGDYASFNLEDSHGPWLGERLSDNEYVSIGGMASASVAPGMPRIAAPFEGTIRYCESAGATADILSCARPVTHVSCTSKNHQLILERR